MTDPRIESAMESWRAAAPELGLNANDFRHKLLWQKDEPGRSHVVLCLVGKDQKLVLKKVFEPEEHIMKQAMDMQQKAFLHMSENADFGAPEVLFVSNDRNTSVMEFLSGNTVNDQLVAGKPTNQVLRRAGAWTSSFHDSFPTRKRMFQPHFMVNHVRRLAEKVESHEIIVPEMDLFLRCCERIPFLADKFMNRQTISAQKHGDLNTRNILMGPQGVVGLDFATESRAPVGYDIARFLTDYTELFQDPTDVMRGQLLSAETVESFFKGYDLVDATDPSVGFLPYVQILNDWRIIPAKSSQRSMRQSGRLANIVLLAKKGFSI